MQAYKAKRTKRSRSSSSSRSSTIYPTPGTEYTQITRKSTILRNPKLSYSFERTAMTQLGFDISTGWTNTSGNVVYGPGLCISFEQSNVKFAGSTANPGNTAIPSATDFTNLFDHWKIDYVKIKMFTTYNVVNQTVNNPATANQGLMILQTAVDTDDGTPPAASTTLLQYQNLRTISMDTNGPKQFAFRPKAVTSLEAGNVFSSGYGQYSGWCDSDYPLTDWFGLKLFIDLSGNATANHQGNVVFYTTIGYSYKGLR